jgi:hypothetical protein
MGVTQFLSNNAKDGVIKKESSTSKGAQALVQESIEQYVTKLYYS